MKLRRILGGLGVIALAAVGTQLVTVQASSAHTPSASVTCTAWSIGAQSYQATQNNTYSYSVDGAPVVTGSFGASFAKSGTFAAGTGNHTLVGYVYQNNLKSAQYSRTYDLTTTGCAMANVTLCHATDSNTHPYQAITVDAAGAYNGHLGHDGPVWNPTLKNDHIKWGDIIPTFTYNGHQHSLNVPAAQSILDNGCSVAVTSVSAGAPAFTDGSCSVDPTYVVPDEPTGVISDVTGASTPLWGKTVTVTFSADEGYLLTGQAVYTHTFSAKPDCRTVVSPVDPTATQASCDHSTGTNGGFVVTLATTDGIDYTVDDLVVTATAKDGHLLGNLPLGWTAAAGSDTVATFTVTKTDAPCLIDVSPVNPDVVQATCDHVTGINSGFTITPATTDGIDYTVDELVVTATAKDGHLLGNLPPGWSPSTGSDTVATLTVAAPSVCLIDASPAVPVVVDPGCSATGTTPIAPTLNIVDQADVTYTQTPGPYVGGGSAIVTATATAGHWFTIATMPSGWTLDGGEPTGTTATYAVTFAAAPLCMTATAPTFADDVCVAGTRVGASLTLPSSDAASYFVDGVLTSDGSYAATDGSLVTVTVQANVGYQLTGATSWTHQFSAAPMCSEVGGGHVVRPPVVHAPAHQPVAATIAPLASTGVPTMSFVLVGGALLLIGGALCVAATTRRGSGS